MDLLTAINWIPFLLAALALNLTPGSDMTFVAANASASVERGALAALGIGAGCFSHVFLATVGVTAIVALSPILFAMLKLIGAGYLLWFAYTLIRSGTSVETAAPVQHSKWQALRQGIWVNALNPKVGIFFLAFLPQFTNPALELIWLQLLMLGLVFTLSGTLVNLVVAVLVSRASVRLRGFRQLGLFLRYTAASMIAFFAVHLLIGEEPR